MTTRTARHAAGTTTSRPVRIAAAVIAAALPVTAVAVSLDGGTPAATASPVPAAPATGPAVINDAFATRAAADADAYVPSDESVWRDAVYDDAGNRLPNVEELKVHSPAMDRDIPVVTIRAKEDAANAPTIYLLNGADGGSGRANWLSQTTAIDFYGNRIGNVNVVIPMSGGFSYYTDWQQASVLDKDGNGKGGIQKWETFLTSELPGAMEQGHLKTSSDKRAIVGMSMTGSTSLVYAEHHPDLYDAVGSYSGCPVTSGVGATAVDVTLAMKGTGVSYEQMWGDRNGATARYNDAQVNVAELRDQQNIYVSSGTGLIGEHDAWTSPDVNENFMNGSTVVGQGGPIEAVTNGCTHMFKAAADKAGVTEKNNNITWNFHNTGTHQWAYWREDMYLSWPTLSAGLFGPESVADAKAVGDKANADYHASL